MKRPGMAAARRGWQSVSVLMAAMCFAASGALCAEPKSKKPPKSAPAVPAKAPAATAPAPARPVEKAPAVDDLYEGPVTKPKPKPAAAVPDENKISAVLSPGPQFADAWPSEYRVAEADLELLPVNDNRAKAVAEFARGLAADDAGDPDKALEAWKQASALDPANAELAVKVAFELAKRNEPSEAIRVLKESIDVAPREPKTHIYLSQVYARHLNKPEFALAAANKAVEVAPDFFPSWAAVHELHEQAGDQKKAGEVLDRALKSPAKDPQFWLQLGAFLQRAFKDDEKPTPDAMRQMEVAFRKAAELRPNDASVLAQVGDFFELARDNRQALEFYERAVKLNQPAVNEATKNLREKFIRALANADRKLEAVELLERLVRDPSAGAGFKLFEYLGELYSQTGQHDKALEQYKQSLLLDNAEPRNHMALAYGLMRAKKFADAVETMEKARKRFPGRSDVLMVLGDALSKAKRHKEALELFGKIAGEAKGRAEGLLDETFFFTWGAVAEQAGEFELAAEKLKRSIELEPNEPQAYNYLGYMWADRGEHLEEAGAMIRKALQMKPNDGAYLDSLGWYFFKSGKFEDAKRELHNAVNALKEEDAVVYDHLGDTYDQLGDKANAIKYWERALKLEPDTADKIRAKIETARK